MQKPGNYIPGGILEACGDWYEDLLEIILQVQKDAYNEAINDIANTTDDGYISIIHVMQLKIK